MGDGNGFVQLRVRHIFSVLLAHAITFLGMAFWIGEQAKQISVDSAKITALEQRFAELDRTGTVNSKLRLDEVVKRLDNIAHELATHSRK